MGIDTRLKAAFGSARATDDECRKAMYGVEMRRKNTGRRRVAAILQTACACVAGILAIVCINIYSSETAYVSLDVNPSISLAINDYGRVIKATGYGTESDALIENMKLSGLPYEAAVSDVLSSEGMQPYLDANGTLWISVQARSPVREAEMEQLVVSAAETALASYQPEIAISALCVSEETRMTAEDAGVSATRYTAIAELQEVDPAADVDALKDTAIYEIHEAVRARHAELEAAAASAAAASAAPAETAAAEEAPTSPQTPEPDTAPLETVEAPGAEVQPQQEAAHHSGHHGSGHHG